MQNVAAVPDDDLDLDQGSGHWFSAPRLMAAMNGILFGWSTAVPFEVLLKTIEYLGSIAAPDTPFSTEDRG